MAADRERQAALQERLKRCAHRCVRLALALPENVVGKHVRGQLIRCSTSVPCNYRAVCLAQSKAAFVAKMSVVLEEADETEFWLEFAVDEGLVEARRVENLRAEAGEIRAIFLAARRTSHKGRYPQPEADGEVREEGAEWPQGADDEF